ncbi:uncharacterized protein LOC109856188 isoform X1 [Pseudomyrmex gracilis]|uniref:uncharacterized protein LOC109856188 isoform X1 n=1 Tax=Pseudomyrmex gracilis TaxID=219809 RepID=UPI00099535BA|nr:uncharacterized protein LOC109856188 isoform X1 [Pseudomyrmex gracilis]XP_020286775.1 uncharacterized protein LOC109856188 isoform X1 [Pseudomyrmex gracilis]
MADTSQPLSEPHTNGVVDGLTEEEKSKIRPADIDADMREMERRKRVEMMMNSRIFREELERIIETQMKDGAGPSGLLQQISDMMGAQGARFNGNVFKNSNCVLPINDIRGVESMGYAKGEKLLRCKLAAVFRLLDLYGWTQGVGGQITARLNQDQEHFLVNPYGLLYHEVTASSLIKVDMQGTVVEQGTTNFGVHITSFQLHSTIHAARPDIKCIIHITTPSVTAISSLKSGLLPIGQESIVIGEVSTHQYIGGSVEPEEREKIARNLGPMNKVMLLTNRGALCCGETVEEAFFNVYNTVVACETQLKLMPVGIDNLNLISDESKKAIFEASRKPPIPQQQSSVESSTLAEKLEKRWRIGGTEFEALMRMLDNAGFRTGYIYRNPLVKGELPKPRNDVEVPPAVSSLGYLLEEEELYKQGFWKGGRKGTDRSRWLNSPNVYQKVEILETGTPDPKKITKWVSDGSPTHNSTPVKIDSALQFVPKNTNPKEFKQIQQQIKDYRRAEKISAGPQSHILEGVSWEEAKKMQDATISGTGEQVVLVGAASKGIIQRGFQHNAMVYKTPYAKNPFDAVTDQELDQYKREIERKQKGDPYDESQSESEALSSFNISRATHESSTAKSPIQSPVSVTSETEEESRDEPRVLRIETKQVPAPSQPEVVLSDVEGATTQFLNELRYSASEQLRSGYKEDYELSSNCSSVNGKCVPTYCGRPVSEQLYDNLHLENVRVSTTAERKKPFLITRSKTQIARNGPDIETRSKAKNSYYEAKRKFFEDLGRQNNSRTESASKRKAANVNSKKDTSERSLRVNLNKELSDNSTEINDSHLTKTNTIKKHIGNRDVCESRTNDIEEYSVKLKNTAQPNYVKRVNVEKTKSNSEDITASNDDSQLEKEMEKTENRKSIEQVSSTENKSSEIKENNDSSNSSDSFDKGEERHQQHRVSTSTKTEITRAHNCANNENESKRRSFRSSSDLSSNKYSSNDRQSGKDEKKSTNGETNDAYVTRIEQKKQNVRSWVENSVCKKWPNNKDVDPYESYCNDIAKIVESIDMNIASSRTELDTLPDTDPCVKYNLDSTNMSIIYSLTPPAVVEQEDSNDDTSHDLAERSWQSDSTKNDDDVGGDYIWIDEKQIATKADCEKTTRDTVTSSDSSYEWEQLEFEKHSASGSDILELPSCTIRELKDIDGEVFQSGINESANEIIADLNISDKELPSRDSLEIARCILTEIIDSVCVLLHLDSCINDLCELRTFLRCLIDSYCCDCMFIESDDHQTYMLDISAMGNDVNNICRLKDFLGSSLPDFRSNDERAKTREKKDRNSSAVIEFCTIAKESPTIITTSDGALELNFCIVKVPSNERADTYRAPGQNSIDNGCEYGTNKILRKKKCNDNTASTKLFDTWPCDGCCCQEVQEDEEENSIIESRLTPINEEPDEIHETIDSFLLTSEANNNTSPYRSEVDLASADAENIVTSAKTKPISLDDTYTISEGGSADNDDAHDTEERCDIWNSSVDYMSYSFDTKEFISLEKAITDSS